MTLYSNKTEQNIEKKKSAALSGVAEIASRFDKVSEVIDRHRDHKHVSAEAEEQLILHDLRRIRPFTHENGRQHDHFRTIPESVVTLLDANRYHRWIHEKKQTFVL